MGAIALNPKRCELIIPQRLYDRLHAHLFPGDRDEHGAVIAAGLAQSADGCMRLLARSVHLARDGIDFVPGRAGYRMFRAEYVRDRMLECADERLIYLNVHNHGGTDRVAFSSDDLASHERGYPALLDLADGLPVGALVFAEGALAGEIWWPDGQRLPVEHATVVGRRRTVLRSAPLARTDPASAHYDRQTRIFGAAGQRILKDAKVGIIGVGGVGALLVEYLARLGVGHFVLIEPERIDHTNLPRFPGATRLDALSWIFEGRWPAWVQAFARRFCAKKLRIARRIIRRANSHARIDTHATDFLEPKTAAATLDCDYLFLAADTMRARLLFNAIVHQYLVPGVQVGSKVSADLLAGLITSVHAISRPVSPDSGCLLCNGLINAARLQEEGQTTEELRGQRYVDDREVAAPSVITLNATAASQAANDFLFYMTALTDPAAHPGFLRFAPTTREAFYEEPRRSIDCGECGASSRSRFARGDFGRRLPTYHRPAASG